MNTGGPPLVSVVMCVYNDDRFVGLAIESILAQTYKNFEFIIVNDGSIDGTAEILAKYAARDARIRVINQPNAGTTAAANVGLALTRGKYIARLDSDDFSYPYRLQIEVDYLEKNPAVALVGGGADIIDLEGRVIGLRNVFTRSPARTLAHRCIYQQSDVMFSAEVARKVGGYREKFRNAQDYDLWLRISEVAQIAKLDVVLGQWRLNPGGYTLSRKFEQESEVKVIKYLARRRRRGLSETYVDYQAKSLPAHRSSINDRSYNIIVALTLIQSLRLKDARKETKKLLEWAPGRRALLLHASTYLPVFAMRVLVLLRSWRLNNFG